MLPLRGFVDRIGEGLVEGWAMLENQPDALNHVEIHAGGRLIGAVLAEWHRDDLVAAGIGSGRHGFSFPLPADIDPLSVEVRCGRTGTALPLSSEARVIGSLAA